MASTIIRSLGHLAHRLVFASKPTASIYLWAWSWARLLPLPPGLVVRLVNSAATIASRIPERFAGGRALPVQTEAGVSISLVPYAQEIDFGILFSPRLHYETDVFRLLGKRVHRYDAIIEIGANVGVFTCTFGKLFQKAGKDVSKILAFEPSPKAFERLMRNLRVNALDEITTFQAAIAAEDGTSTLYEPEGHLTNGSLLADFAAVFSPTVRPTAVQTIAASRIHQFVPSTGEVLIKIDAEGFEATILGSLLPFINERRPDLIVEVLPATAEGIADVFADMHGYRAFQIARDGLHESPLCRAGDARDWLLTTSL
jgi:FkbM family methyltransferase